MPGAFHLEAPNGAAPLSGIHAGIFRSPASPSISNSMYLGESTGRLYSDASAPAFAVKRKRQGPRGSTPVDQHAHMEVDSAMGNRPLAGRRISSGRDSRYTFAGSVETPNAQEQRQLGNMDDSTYSDVDYRRALGSKRQQDTVESTSSNQPVPRPAPGWSRLALDTIGGVVGKVWEFCKEGAFRGFYAGGGRGYEMNSAPAQAKPWCNEHDVPTLPDIPGGFPESDYSPFHYEHETMDSTPPPAAKRRRQIFDNTPNDELRKNWVMVNDSTGKKSEPNLTAQAQGPSQTRPTLDRRIGKPVSRLSNPILARGNSSRVSHAGSPSLNNRQAASFASPRSPVVPDRPVTPSRLPVPARPRSSSTISPKVLQHSLIASPSPYSGRGHRRAHSTASAASGATGRMSRRESSAQEIVDERSPRLDATAKNMVAKRMKQEQETDVRINNFNTRLMDMIRQGKEALGTTVEVDGFDDDDGVNDPWEDD